MDKVEHYRQIVQATLLAHSQIQPAYGDIEMEILFDQERDRYQVLRAGWLQKQQSVFIAIANLGLVISTTREYVKNSYPLPITHYQKFVAHT